MSVIPVPDPPLSDGVVTLRRFEPHDAATIADACSDPLIPRFTFMADDLTPEKAMEWIERRAEQWRTGQVAGFAIVGTVDPRRLIGTIGLGINQSFVTGEVFYWVVARSAAEASQRARFNSSRRGLSRSSHWSDSSCSPTQTTLHRRRSRRRVATPTRAPCARTDRSRRVAWTRPCSRSFREN